jgi:hypothetical protein
MIMSGCPQCGEFAAFPPDQAGQEATCKACGAEFEVQPLTRPATERSPAHPAEPSDSALPEPEIAPPIPAAGETTRLPPPEELPNPPDEPELAADAAMPAPPDEEPPPPEPAENLPSLDLPIDETFPKSLRDPKHIPIRRALLPAAPELEKIVRRKINAWAAAVPHHPHRRLGDAIEMARVVVAPAYALKLQSIAVTEEVAPFKFRKSQFTPPAHSVREGGWDECRARLVREAGFADGKIEVLHEESVTEPACAECAGTPVKECEACQGQGKTPCVKCHGTGACTPCAGRGARQLGGKDQKCAACGGTGTCKHCQGGTASCNSCGGEGRIACPSCGGDGAFVEGRMTAVTIKTLERSKIVSGLPDPLAKNVQALLELEAPLYHREARSIETSDFIEWPHPELVDGIAEVSGSDEATARQRLEIRMVEILQVDYRFENRPYTFYLLGPEMTPVSAVDPISEHLQSLVEDSEELKTKKPEAAMTTALHALAMSFGYETEQERCYDLFSRVRRIVLVLSAAVPFAMALLLILILGLATDLAFFRLLLLGLGSAAVSAGAGTWVALKAMPRSPLRYVVSPGMFLLLVPGIVLGWWAFLPGLLACGALAFAVTRKMAVDEYVTTLEAIPKYAPAESRGRTIAMAGTAAAAVAALAVSFFPASAESKEPPVVVKPPDHRPPKPPEPDPPKPPEPDPPKPPEPEPPKPPEPEPPKPPEPEPPKPPEPEPPKPPEPDPPKPPEPEPPKPPDPEPPKPPEPEPPKPPEPEPPKPPEPPPPEDLERQKRYDEAMALAEKAIGERKWTEAQTAVNAALDVKPDDPAALALRAMANEGERDARFSEAFDRAKKHSEAKEWSQARAAAEEALAFRAEDPEAKRLREEAIAAEEREIGAGPEAARRFTEAWTAERQGKLEQALAGYAALARDYPQTDRGRMAAARMAWFPLVAGLKRTYVDESGKEYSSAVAPAVARKVQLSNGAVDVRSYAFEGVLGPREFFVHGEFVYLARDAVAEYVKPLPYLPIEPSAGGKFDVAAVAQSGSERIDVAGVIQILAEEQVSVPAGKFAAFRVRVEDDSGNHQVLWVARGLGPVKIERWKYGRRAPELSVSLKSSLWEGK